MKLNLFLLALLAVSVGANLAIRDKPARLNLEVMPDMVRSAAYKSFEANPNFADGKTLQPPPEGTIPRRRRTVRYAAPAGRGARVFQIYCQPCHGGAGKGDGPVARRGFPPPPSLLAPHALGLSDSQIFQIITSGQRNMPSYAAQVPVEDRRAVIAYVRSLQKGVKP